MNKIYTVLLLTSLLHSGAVVAEKESDGVTTTHETAGFGIGALIGGLIAGPPGAVIGAAGGTLYGYRNGKKAVMITNMEQQLQERNIELARLQQEFNNTQFAYTEDLQKVIYENRRATAENISNNISFSVYFRTNESGLDSTLTPHICDLVNLILDVPYINVDLEAHSDHRGNPEYNLELSLARANSVRLELIKAGLPANRIISHAYGETRAKAVKGDHEDYIFDRRVDLQLTLSSEI
jgi:outer membrane protein OmpA-like peptidoglycan-associated protein